MNFKPILFSTEMVKAILSGSKVQTRRVVKPQPTNNDYSPTFFTDHFGKQFLEFRKSEVLVESKTWECPYGQVGDVLWVRETFAKIKSLETGLTYSLTKADFEHYENKLIQGEKVKWKPSIHMPKEACRLFLKIKSIRVERLRDISEADAVYEGIEVIHFAEPSVPIFKRYDLKEKLGTVNPIFSFESLWQKINGRQSLINNPWVWVIEFERIEKPENF